MEYFDPYNHPQPQAIYQHPAFAQSNMAQEYPSYVDQHQRMYTMPRRAQSMTNLNQLASANQHGEKNDTKPRLSKQEVEILERQFQEQHKPSSNTKRQIAERFQVDVSRINNWFQNRRAKAKHERRHEEEGIAQANRQRTYSDPPSPGNFAQDDYTSDNQFQSPESQGSTFAMPNGSLPAAAAPCNVRYENPAAASRNSLQRTLYEAECGAAERGEISSDNFQEEVSDDHFDPTLDLTNAGLPMASHAQFPMPEEQAINNTFTYIPEPIFEPMFSMEHMPHQPMTVQEPSSDVYGCYITQSPEHHSSLDGAMTTFPSQLLPGSHDVSELTPRPFLAQEFSPIILDASQSPLNPMESRLMSPPPAPAVPIAHRRRKHLPAAIGTPAVQDKSSSGPKTCNIPRPLNSPSIKMRRVSSVNGSLAVKAGRIQKTNSYLPQRSPLLRHFSEGGAPFLERNAGNVQHMPMPMLSATSATWKQLSPPTPNSPREMLLAQQYENMQREGTAQQQTFVESHKGASSSPSESEQSYSFNRQSSNFFTLNAINTNMASPPETPSLPGGQQHWGYDVPDDALLTPGLFGNFALDGLHHPQPHYVSPLTCSQPQTPAFGQFAGFPYVHASPVIELTDNSEVDYHNQYFSEGGSSVSSYPTVSSTHSSPEVAKNDKVYQFNNATPKDFEQSV